MRWVPRKALGLALWLWPVGVLGILVTSLSTTIPPGDGAELATAAVRLGVAHPSGYPLFTLLGHAATRLPWIPLDPLIRLGLLDALYATGAGVCVALAVRALATLSNRRRQRPACTAVTALAGALAGTALATTPALAREVRGLEVYPLHLLFVSASLLGLVRFEAAGHRRDILLAVGAAALGGAHHPTIVYLWAAGLVYLAWRARSIVTPGMVAAAAAMLTGSLLLYGTLFHADATTTAVPWGHVHDLASLRSHVAPAGYAGFMRGWSPLLVSRALEIPSWLCDQLTIPLSVAALVGFVAVVRSSPPIAVLLVLVAASNLLHGAQYAVGDFSSYYLPALVPAFAFAGVGLVSAAALLPPGWSATALAAGLIASLGLAAARIAPNPAGPQVYAADVVGTVPPGSLLLTARDPFVFPLWYAQHVRGEGDGIAVVNVLMLAQDWYREWYLERRHPAACDPLGEGPAAGEGSGEGDTCGDYADRIARYDEEPVSWLRFDLSPEPPGTATGPTHERDGKVRRFGPEIWAHRLIVDHLDERPVFERNFFTLWSEGKVGRPWEGPAFHRPSGRFALLNRGRVNQIVHREDVAGRDACAADVLEPVAIRRRSPRAPHAAREPARQPYVPNDQPVLIRSSAIVGPNGRDSALGPLPLAPVSLVLDWFEQNLPSAASPRALGPPIRWGIRVCFFGPDGRRLQRVSLVSGGEPGTVSLPAERVAGPGTYTVQACSIGDVTPSGRIPPERPCRQTVLERTFELVREGAGTGRP